MPNGNEREYKTLVTAIGKSKIAAVIQGSDKTNITQVAVGDGNGAFYVPTADMTALVHEVWRGNIAGKWINEHSANMIDVKVVLPADVGGFTVREAALFDEDNNMIAICNVPDTEKAVITTGAAGTLTLVMHIVLTDVDAVEFTIDPYLDVVTGADVELEVRRHNADLNAHPGLLKAKKISYNNTKIEAKNVHNALDTLLDENLPSLNEDMQAVKLSIEQIMEKAKFGGTVTYEIPKEGYEGGLFAYGRDTIDFPSGTENNMQSGFVFNLAKIEVDMARYEADVEAGTIEDFPEDVYDLPLDEMVPIFEEQYKDYMTISQQPWCPNTIKPLLYYALEMPEDGGMLPQHIFRNDIKIQIVIEREYTGEEIIIIAQQNIIGVNGDLYLKGIKGMLPVVLKYSESNDNGLETVFIAIWLVGNIPKYGSDNKYVTIDDTVKEVTFTFIPNNTYVEADKNDESV